MKVINPWKLRELYLKAIKETPRPGMGVSSNIMNSDRINYYQKVSKTYDKVLREAGIEVEGMI